MGKIQRVLATLLSCLVVLAGPAMLAASPASATPGVDLSLDLTDNDARFVVGQNATYQVKVRNAGTATATGTTSVELDWYYPRQQFVSATGAGWSCASDGNTNGERVTCQRTGSIAAGASAPTITLTVAVKAAAYPQTYASAYLNNPSDDTGADFDNQYTAVDGPDASLAMSGPTTMTVGSDSTVTVTASNAGTRAATGTLTVVVVGYSTMELRGASGPGWTCVVVDENRSCSHAFNLAAGAAVPALSVTVRPRKGAYPSGQLQAQIESGTNSTTNASSNGDNAYFSTAVNGIPDLSVGNGLNLTDETLTVGTNETATLDLQNVGTVTNTGLITTTFSLPAGLTYVSRTGTGWTCGTSTGQLVCTRTANLAAGAHAPLLQLTFSVSAQAYPSASISAYVQNAGADDPAYGPNGYNNGASDYAYVDGVVDLQVQTVPYSQNVVAGSTAPVTVTVSSVSTKPATGTTTVEADLPSGVTMASSSGAGWTCGVATSHLTCSRTGTIAAGASAPDLGLVFRFDASLVNTSQYTRFEVSNADDVYASNDSYPSYWYVQPAVDLTTFLSGTVPGGAVSTGQAVEFTLNAYNTGTEPATGTTRVVYTVPAGLTFTSRANGPGFSCTKAGATITCTRTTSIAVGTTAVAATVRGTIAAAGGTSFDHCVTVTNASDANPSNDTSCSSYTVRSVAVQDLTVTTTHAPTTFTAGNNGTVRATPRNSGGVSTSGTVTAQLTAGTGLSILSASGTNWSCAGSGASTTCTTTAVATAGADLSQITAVVRATAAAAPSSTVTATVSGGGQTNTANDTATETIPVGSTPPSAVFSASPTLGIAPVTVSFDGSGSTGASSYAWKFGDGAVATGPTTSHTYTTPGTYNAVLTVTNPGGQTDTASRVVTVGTSAPLDAKAGDDVVTAGGAVVEFNGSGSAPNPGITAYTWDFGDGTTGTGPMPTHTYTNAGPGDVTRTVTLTVGVGDSTDTDTATVVVKPSPGAGSGGLDVTVTNAAGGGPVSQASLAVIDAYGNRYQAASDSSGDATIYGLANGDYTVYAYAAGFKPKVLSATVAGGTGAAAVALERGAVGATTVESDRLSYDEIVAAGIDPADPANNHVYEFVICLSFDVNAVCQAEMTGQVNEEGTIYNGDFAGSGGSCTSNECTAGVGGYSVRGTIGFPAGPDYPVGQFLLIPGEARWLKEFFEVKLVTTNLSPEGFTFTDGSASLDLPAGMSLAPTGTAQSLQQPVADIPGGGGPDSSKTTTWILRGDEEGDYPLTAQYAATLEPVGAPIHLTAAGETPVKVWAGAALRMTVRADSTATAGEPYRVRIGLTNVTTGPDATDVYNPVVELKKAGATNFVYQPLERLAQGTARIQPGETFWTDDYVLFPTISGQLHPENSAVFRTGGDVNIAAAIGAPLTPVAPLATTGSDQPGGVRLSWAPASGATGYRIFKTADPSTQFGDVPEVTVGPGVTSVDLPQPQGKAYYTVSSTRAGRPVALHRLVPATALAVPEVSVADATVFEGSSGLTKATVTVRLSEPAPFPVSVQYDTAAGTADATDFGPKVGGTLTIAPNTTSSSIVVPVKGDVVDENDETLSVALSEPVNATLRRASGAVTIWDDDAARPSRISLGDVSVGEGSGGPTTARVMLTVSPPSPDPISVRLTTADGAATASSDYTQRNALITIPARSKGIAVPLTVTGDALDEPDESFGLTLSAPTNGAELGDSSGAVRIIDDDPGTGLAVLVGDVSLDEADTAGTPVSVPVTLTAPAPAGGVEVTYATSDQTATTAGADYVAKTQTLTIAAGATSASIPVTVTGDGLFEADETFGVTLSAATNGASIARPDATITIRNDESPPVLSLAVADSTHAEGDTGVAAAKVTVTLSAPASSAVSVHWTLMNGTANSADYAATATGTLTIAAGATSGTVGVAVKGDLRAEPNETFTVVLDSPVGAGLGRSTGTVTILDDD